MPFGEEVGAGVGGRTTNQGYSVADGVRQGYTGYEKDGETGLNFAQNRYHSPIQGRFTSPDPLNSSGIPGLPQSWNRYAYCVNNPLLYTDPNGLIWGYQDSKDGKVRTFRWFDGDEVDADWTKYEHNYFIGSEQGVFLGYNGKYRYTTREEAAAGLLDAHLRGPNSPLGAEEKEELQRAFAERMFNEHPEIKATAAAVGGLLGSLANGLRGFFGSAASQEINAAELQLSGTVANHLDDVTKAGLRARPYGDSRLVMQEIMRAGKAVPDPGGVPGALRWDVPGSVMMNGAKQASQGTWELVIDPRTSTVLHFVFKSSK